MAKKTVAAKKGMLKLMLMDNYMFIPHSIT